MSDDAHKNTSVFPQGDLSHAESPRRGAERPRSVAAAIDRKGWKRVRLGDVCIIKARIGWQGLKKSEYMNQGDYCLVSGTDFRNGFINWETCSFVTEWRYNQDKNIQLKDGDVLITKDGTIGKVAYVQAMKAPTTLNSGVFVIRPREEWLTPDFLQLIFKSRYFTDFLDRITAGSTIVHLYQKDIVGFSFPVQNLEEQHRIAKCIAAIDRQITTLQSLIAKYEAIKKATVNLLLKPKEGWRRVKLEDFEAHRNNTCSRSLTSSTDGEIHNIHYGDILVKFGEIVSLEHDQVDWLTKEGESHSPKDYLQDGDIVIADTAEDETAGKVVEVQGVADQRVVAGLHTVFLRPPTDLFARGWLGYWMNSRFYHDQLLPYMTGIKVLSLSKSSLSNTEIYFPSKAEQGRLVESLESIDTHIVALHAQTDNARQLKAGMMLHFFG